ncbi:hypothetical protein ABPG74_002377 [Tetrahymena malaccensis]
MIGEGICVSQGQVLKHLMNDIPKRNLGLVTLHRGQLVNKKIRHTNRNEHDVHYKLVSDSPLIYFRQRSNFEVIADCFTYIRIQIGVPINYDGPKKTNVNLYLKRKDVDLVEEIYSFDVQIEDSTQSS